MKYARQHGIQSRISNEEDFRKEVHDVPSTGLGSIARDVSHASDIDLVV